MMNDSINFTKQADGNYTATVKCPICGKETTIKDISSRGLFVYNQGALIQQAFPNMSIKERETLISGFCKTCQDNFFGGWEDDTDEDDVEQELEEEAKASV